VVFATRAVAISLHHEPGSRDKHQAGRELVRRVTGHITYQRGLLVLMILFRPSVILGVIFLERLGQREQIGRRKCAPSQNRLRPRACPPIVRESVRRTRRAHSLLLDARAQFWPEASRMPHVRELTTRSLGRSTSVM